MKSVYSVVVVAALLVAAPFASAFATRQELHDKLVARLHSRQAGCATQACTLFAEAYTQCVASPSAGVFGGLDCICANKPAALACYAVRGSWLAMQPGLNAE